MTRRVKDGVLFFRQRGRDGTMSAVMERATTYGEYLRIPELLGLQKTLTPAHDELQFIVVHQVFELWFKLALHELDALRAAMRGDDLARAAHLLRRLQALVRTVTAGFDVIETMRPYDFLEFRSALQPASGFQSVQFREIEFLCGLKDERYVRLLDGDERLARRMKESTLWDAYVELLGRHGLKSGSEKEIVASVIEVMKRPDAHALGPLTEELIELDELFSLWRARHIRMTMRMIGSKPGTGEKTVQKLVREGYERMGSAGVDYLKTTLSKTFFPLLWEARTFIRR
ncbi:MAG: tryptophan 2,3-dioxygenase [Planctomycetes bacterium]|nr:tryptophan 2,3-dioxygenase [Planctomycetota bacterium]